MKVEGPKAPQTVGKTGSARKSGDAGAFSSLLESGGAGETAQTSPSSGVAAVSGLFMLQDAAADEGRKRQKAIDDAREDLDILDQLMRAVLFNNVTMSTLEQLRARAVRNGPDVSDPQLAAVLAQVDIRLAVEAAKLEKAAESNT